MNSCSIFVNTQTVYGQKFGGGGQKSPIPYVQEIFKAQLIILAAWMNAFFFHILYF